MNVLLISVIICLPGIFGTIYFKLRCYSYKKKNVKFIKEYNEIIEDVLKLNEQLGESQRKLKNKELEFNWLKSDFDNYRKTTQLDCNPKKTDKGSDMNPDK